MKKYKKLLSTYNEVVKAKKEEKKECFCKKIDFTFEETTLLKEKMSLMYDMTRWVKHYNQIDNFVPDWLNIYQSKHGLITRKEVMPAWTFTGKSLVFGLAVSSEKRAEQMLKEFGSRIEKYY
jgi:hypothetical protein